jgi:hypothetical protein
MQPNAAGWASSFEKRPPGAYRPGALHTPYEQRAPDAPEAPGDGEPLLGPLARAPGLAMVAAAAAVVSLLLNQVVLRSIGPSLPHDRVVLLARWFSLPRNLAAIAAIVALLGAIYHFLRLRRIAPLERRMLVAAFAGVFLPTVTFAALFPAPHFLASTPMAPGGLLLLGLGSASTLGVMVVLIAIGRHGPFGLRGALALYGLSVLFALGAVVAPLFFAGAEMWRTSAQVVRVLRGASEVTYLLAPLVAVPSLRPVYPPRRARLGLGVGTAVAAAVVGLFAWGRLALRSDFAVVLYGVQRLDLLLDVVPWLYALPLAAGFGMGAAALTSASPPDRQAGAGLVLVLCGGHAPNSPFQLLMMALGLSLMARAFLAQAIAIETTRSPGARGGVSEG